MIIPYFNNDDFGNSSFINTAVGQPRHRVIAKYKKNSELFVHIHCEFAFSISG